MLAAVRYSLEILGVRKLLQKNLRVKEESS